jgi:uncharacterized protein
VVGGYCPGTSVVAAATGRIDGLFFAAGLAAGTLGFALAFPLVKGLYLAGDLGEQTLPEALGIRWGVVALAVVVTALAGFMGAGWVERKMSAKAAPAED